jgi:thioredoxin reductase (NADPH)
MPDLCSSSEPRGRDDAERRADAGHRWQDAREFDVALIGGGPVGLYGAYCAGFRGQTAVVIDALPELGGQVSAMYPEKFVFDVAGFEAVRGRELVSGLTAQADRYGPTYLLGQSAVTLEDQGDGRKLITTSAGTVISARSLIITGGIGSFSPRRLPVAEAYEGRGLVYFVPHLRSCAGADVVIVGGGDSAFDWAQALEPIAGSVTLVHRRSRFRAHAGTIAAVQRSTVRVVVDATIGEVQGDGRIQRVTIESVDGSRSEQVPCQVLIAALGFTADLGPVESWGLEVADRRILVDSHMATNVPGVFAAGDIADYPGKVRLMSVGFGEVATAVSNAVVSADPHASLFPGHSSDVEERETCRT